MLTAIERPSLDTKQRFRLTLSYNGSDFMGWQEQRVEGQPNFSMPTVQAALIRAFERTFNQSLTLVGASRTDSGVHARGQVALATVDLQLSASRLLNIWNAALPKSIYINDLAAADDLFHPQHGVDYKIYSYRIWLQRPKPFDDAIGWWWPLINRVDLSIVQQVLQCFVGEHDFRYFCKQEGIGRPTKRKVEIIDFVVNSDSWLITFQAPGFLYMQIRRMLGAALEAGLRGCFELELIQKALTGLRPDPNAVPNFCVGPDGLCLERIVYKKN